MMTSGSDRIKLGTRTKGYRTNAVYLPRLYVFMYDTGMIFYEVGAMVFPANGLRMNERVVSHRFFSQLLVAGNHEAGREGWDIPFLG